ncbi:SWIM zinc finger family protein [Streptomyces sp. ISL-98]|uniref:SWIM zinc finger family protein n=1 Tax=Streptomyces sp. ISL-98 TaxID=2819192 RepID=UPI001BEC5E4C|nr:SWIM zinc finger family protein [Streptomyces sp. ISL-98]MBT2504498.1 SWIM zinc finger family protein [Streptomyces sp. ISL-98]
MSTSWWGNAWIEALEALSLDPARLARGRTYASEGNVGAISVTPGRIITYVRGSRPRPYRTEIRLQVLSDEDWDRFLTMAAADPAHMAALLDKDMPHSLVESAAEVGVGLLPAPGDLIPSCSCPDHGHPCKHAAALCYETARLLDADPFVLFVMRGRAERDLLDDLARRNAAHSAREKPAPPPFPGVLAATALTPRTLPPLPGPLPVPPHAGHASGAYPGTRGAPDPLALDLLVTDAAARAHTLLTTGTDPIATLTPWQDAVRLAAAQPGSGLTAATRTLYARLASATGRTPTDLARAVAAWQQGGLTGLSVLETPWDPPAGPFDRARPALAAADLPRLRPHRNRLSDGERGIQLRLGHDDRWYPYESDPGTDDWWPTGTPDEDPVGALTELLDD